MPTAVIDNPILNSPFAEPTRHWVLDENGIPTGFPAEGRRRSEFVVPVPPPEQRVKDEGSFHLETNCGTCSRPLNGTEPPETSAKRLADGVER